MEVARSRPVMPIPVWSWRPPSTSIGRLDCDLLPSSGPTSGVSNANALHSVTFLTFDHQSGNLTHQSRIAFTMTCAVGRISIAGATFLEHILRGELRNREHGPGILDIKDTRAPKGRTWCARFLTAFRQGAHRAPPSPHHCGHPARPGPSEGTGFERYQPTARTGRTACWRPWSCDFSLLAPNLKDFSLKLGEVLQEPGEHFNQVIFPKRNDLPIGP